MHDDVNRDLRVDKSYFRPLHFLHVASADVYLVIPRD